MGRRSRELRERRLARERRAQHVVALRETAEKRGCLFCRRSDGGFTTPEHVFPESLGNTELILEPGVVCDRCNHQTLSVLDQVICNFSPIAMRRTMLGIPSKAGKVPVFRFAEGTVEFIPGPKGHEPKLIVKASSGREVLREVRRTEDGRVQLEWHSSSRPMTAHHASELSRAILKSAFECAWLDHGEMMLEERFDHIREAVLGVPRDGFFAAMRKADPEFRAVSLTYDLVPWNKNHWRMYVAGNYFGAWLGTDSRLAHPVQELPEEIINVAPFSASELVGKHNPARRGR